MFLRSVYTSTMGDNDPVPRRRVKIREVRDDDPDTDYQTDALLEHDGDRVGDAADNDDSPKRRVRRRTRTELEHLHFRMVNERVVEDITMDVFYKPHTITILLALCGVLAYLAFQSTSDNPAKNVYDGLLGTLALFLIVSALAFPNGPFIRPHPIVWRITFGLSVVYMLLLQFTLFQTFDDIKKVLAYLDPKGLGQEKLVEKEYAVNCSDITFERVWSHVDIFAVGHFLGWTMKGILIRHSILCWYISFAWELTEVVFTHLLPNFAECWWDALILDVLLCNGIGIWVGIKICHIFEMRQFHWESVRQIRTTRGKVKRAVLQFTPESWSGMDWFSSEGALGRTWSLVIFILLWLGVELNTFFVKHIFAVDTSHPVVFWRIILIGAISAPSIRQYYLYATDPLVTRLGMQSWVFLAVGALEAAICVKFGRHLFPPMQLMRLAVWVLFVIVGTFFVVWLSVWYANWSSNTKVVKEGGVKRSMYLDSSHENLGLIGGDVRRRRRELGMSESDMN